MTDLAQTSNDKTGLQAADDELLMLPSEGGAIPRTVYVKAITGDLIKRAGFALQNPSASKTSATLVTAGVEWEFEPDDVQYGCFINFVLVDGIDELKLPDPLPPSDPVFWFSETYSPIAGQALNQLSCTPIVAKQTTTYHFRAMFTGGGSIDPKIVITPIPKA